MKKLLKLKLILSPFSFSDGIIKLKTVPKRSRLHKKNNVKRVDPNQIRNNQDMKLTSRQKQRRVMSGRI